MDFPLLKKWRREISVEKTRLTGNDINRIIPPKEKEEAIKQSERYEKEYEQSRIELEKIRKNLEELKAALKQLEELQNNQDI